VKFYVKYFNKKMSRIGKQLINFDDSIKVTYVNSLLTVSGPKGELTLNVPSELTLSLKDNEIHVIVREDNGDSNAVWGLTRSLIHNMTVGVKDSFTKKLVLVGPGYKATTEENYLVLKLGYSHDIIYSYPKTLTLKCQKDTTIEISGCDKQLVGQVAAEIRDFRKPEPYKGKGVKYSDEIIVRKKGKDSKK